MTNQFSNAQNPNDEGVAVASGAALCRHVENAVAEDRRGKTPTSNVGAHLAGAVHDNVVDLEMWAWFCAMRFWTAAVGTGSKVCRAASRARAFGKLFTDFQLFPLISTCFRSFDNKNIFRVCQPGRSLGWSVGDRAGFHGASRLGQTRLVTRFNHARTLILNFFI